MSHLSKKKKERNGKERHIKHHNQKHIQIQS